MNTNIFNNFAKERKNQEVKRAYENNEVKHPNIFNTFSEISSKLEETLVKEVNGRMYLVLSSEQHIQLSQGAMPNNDPVINYMNELKQKLKNKPEYTKEISFLNHAVNLRSKGYAIDAIIDGKKGYVQEKAFD